MTLNRKVMTQSSHEIIIVWNVEISVAGGYKAVLLPFVNQMSKLSSVRE